MYILGGTLTVDSHDKGCYRNPIVRDCWQAVIILRKNVLINRENIILSRGGVIIFISSVSGC